MKKAVVKKIGGPSKRKAKKPRTRSAILQTHEDKLPPAPSLGYEMIEEQAIPKAAWATFLQDLSETGNVTKSCKRVGIKRITVYKRAARNQEFHDLMEEAHAIGLRALEDHAVLRATEGVQRDVYFQGEVVGHHMEMSDQLLMFLLQGRDSRYKRKQEISGPDGAALTLLMRLSDEELEAEIAKRQADITETPGS